MNAIENQVSRSQSSPAIPALIPYVLALLLGAQAMIGYRTTDPVDSDAARHAMNGVFIYDMVRTGHFLHPIEYARDYYAHFPALTLPYHPPVFPAIEALFYAVLGVNVFAARLAVAIAVGICALLMYRLFCATNGNQTVAICALVSVIMCGISRRAASDTMLEFPAMAFTLGALLLVKDLDRPWTLTRAIGFGVLAGTAVWTKQHAVFVGMVPVAWPILAGRPRLLLQKWLWVGEAIFSAIVGGLIALSAQARNVGVNQLSRNPDSVLRWTFPYYWKVITGNLHGWTLAFTVGAVVTIAWAFWRRDRRELKLGLYAVWILTYCLLLIALKATDLRYLFFIFPAFFMMSYTCMWAVCSALIGTRWTRPLVLGAAAVWAVGGLTLEPPYVHGIREAAAIVTQKPGARILYSGDAIGNFVFDVRTHDPNLSASVIQVRRLTDDMLEPKPFSDLCTRYGFDWVLVGEHSRLLWMLKHPPPGAVLTNLVTEHSNYAWNGTMHIFRLAPSQHPSGVLEIPIPRIGQSVRLKL